MVEKKLSTFLDKYKKIRVPNEGIRQTTSKELEKIVGVDVPLRSINYTKGVIKIKTNPHTKREVLLKKEDILSSINKKLNIRVRDII